MKACKGASVKYYEVRNKIFVQNYLSDLLFIIIRRRNCEYAENSINFVLGCITVTYEQLSTVKISVFISSNLLKSSQKNSWRCATEIDT